MKPGYFPIVRQYDYQGYFHWNVGHITTLRQLFQSFQHTIFEQDSYHMYTWIPRTQPPYAHQESHSLPKLHPFCSNCYMKKS